MDTRVGPIEHSQMDPTEGTGPLKGKKEHDVQLCPGVHSEHSLMDTEVGPIEHSQMDPTEGNRPFDSEEGKKEAFRNNREDS
jgi:hypothetical protein